MPIPNVSTLYEKIYKGSEGGQEFARVINLLLIAESRNQDFQLIDSSDASGDYKGVDSIILRKDQNIGVQYKFVPVPLSSNHKREIRKSLETALNKFPEMNKWILIIPYNPSQYTHAWLDGLSKEYEIEIECWGHLRILELMLKYPHIAQNYYPELKSIQLQQSPTNEIALSYFNQFLDTDFDVNSLFFRAQPNISDCKTVFTSKYYKEICDIYYYTYRDSMDGNNEKGKIESATTVKIDSYTLTDIRNASDHLPGGMRQLFQEYDALHPGIKFYIVHFFNDKNELIMNYSVWCYINGRWIFFFKPWRIMSTINQLSNDSEIKSIVRLLKFFRIQKYRKNLKHINPFIWMNHVTYQLFK